MTVHIKLSQGPGIFNSRTNSGGGGLGVKEAMGNSNETLQS